MKRLLRMFALTAIIGSVICICAFAHDIASVRADNLAAAPSPSNHVPALAPSQVAGDYRGMELDLTVSLDELADELADELDQPIIYIEDRQRVTLHLDLLSDQQNADVDFQKLGTLAACYSKEIYTNQNSLDVATDIFFNFKFYDESAEGQELGIYCPGVRLRNSSAIDVTILPGTARYVNETAGLSVELADVLATDVYFTLDQPIVDAIKEHGRSDLGAVLVDVLPQYVAAARLISSAGNYNARGKAGSQREHSSVVARFNDTLIFGVDVYNIGQKSISGANLNVALPDGVVLQSGTTRINDKPADDSLKSGSLLLPILPAGAVYNIQFIAEVDMPVSSYERVLPALITLLYDQESYSTDYISIQIEPDEMYTRNANYRANIPMLLSFTTALLSLVGVFGPKYIDTITCGVNRRKANKVMLYIGIGLFSLLVALSLPLLLPGLLRVWPWTLISRK